MAAIQPREPVVFTVGDTLSFQKALTDFPASDGWSLEYFLYTLAGKDTGVEFTSAAASDGAAEHLVDVDNFAATLAPGIYVLAGFAVKAAVRQQIFGGQLTLQPNLPSGADAPSQKWFEQEMVELLEASLRRLYAHELKETDVQRVRILRADREEVQNQHAIWTERLNNRKKIERVRNGGSAGDAVVPVFRIFG